MEFRFGHRLTSVVGLLLVGGEALIEPCQLVLFFSLSFFVNPMSGVHRRVTDEVQV
jgi:hypothetical protein